MSKAGYKRHVFVCLNERDPADARGCCKQRINRAGCLDHCEHVVGARVVERLLMDNIA